jgi:putative sigma-54 modulation protein
VEITVSARNVDVSPALRQAAEEKLARLPRFLGGIQRAVVHFAAEQNPRIPAREICEVTLDAGRRVLRCKVSAHDAFAAVDLAVAKLEQQLLKAKSKTVSRRRGARSGDVLRVATA